MLAGTGNNGITITSNSYNVGTIGREVGGTNNTDMLINANTKMALNSVSGAITLATGSTNAGQNIYIVSTDIPGSNHQDQIALGSGGGK